MVDVTQPVVVSAEHRERESFKEPARGDATWFTLFSHGMTPTSALTAGITELAPGGVGLAAHRHAQPEIYYILAGSGVVTIERTETPVAPGAAVFIPGDAEHSLRNASPETLRVLYVFPADRFADVVYRFSSETTR